MEDPEAKEKKLKPHARLRVMNYSEPIRCNACKNCEITEHKAGRVIRIDHYCLMAETLVSFRGTCDMAEPKVDSKTQMIAAHNR
jgi:hypothetical protein